MNRLRVAAAVLSAVLVVEVATLAVLVMSNDGGGTVHTIEPATAEIRDKPAPEPPLYYQKDERWGGLPYATADSDIAESGCGLCCAAMAASYITGEDITPPVLLNLIGNRCIDAGQNHMGRFCEELQSLYGIEYQDLWSLENAEEYLRAGWMIFAGMGGKVYPEGREYGAHVLLIWRCDDSGVYIRDPDDVNLTTPITWEQFESIEWGSYFYAIREGKS